MSNSANAEAQADQIPGEDTEQKKTFQEQVNETVKGMTFNEDKQVFELPEGEHTEELKFAVMAEKRRRDTESVLGKTRQKAKATEAENTELKKRLGQTVQVVITPEEKQELDDLKYSDPDAWRSKVNELETRAAAKLNEDLGEINASASHQAEIERRSQVLDQFSEEHDGFVFTDEMLADDIPPRITKKLSDGKITYEEFLDESYKYLHTKKVVKTEDLEAQPNLGSVGGNDTPSKDNADKDIVGSYKNDIY